MKKSIIVGLLCTVILFGFTGCFHWFERAATYQENMYLLPIQLSR